jgi:mono/diheme cytochrome c family protein
VDTDSDAVANVGHGIYVQDCATCHGISGMGNGPASISMESKPSNFTRPFFKQYNDLFWYYRISEGVPGTRMPRWRETLSEAQRWYLVAYLKRLPGQEEKVTRSVHDLDQFFMEMQHVHHEWNPPFLEGTKKTQAGGS